MSCADCAVMQRSFMRAHVFGIGPAEHDKLAKNQSVLLYDSYLAHPWSQGETGGNEATSYVEYSFLEYARIHQLDEKKAVKARNFRRGPRAGSTIAVGIRYKYELTDLYLGQFNASQFPHKKASVFVPATSGPQDTLAYTLYWVGTARYLQNLKYCDLPWYMGLPIVQCGDDEEEQYALAAFPGMRAWYEADAVRWREGMLARGERVCDFAPGGPVFTEDSMYKYVEYVHLRDLVCRSIGEVRKRSFQARLSALRRFCHWAEHISEYNDFGFVHVAPMDESVMDPAMREVQNKGKYARLKEKWDPKASGTGGPSYEYRDQQADFLERVRRGRGRQDANEEYEQWLHLCGKPGTGKTRVLIRAAMEAVQDGLRVCILVPTGALVHQYRSELPEMENLVVETFHAGMCIMRNNDKVVTFQPPSRFRRYDVFLCDEGSQITDDVWLKFYMAVMEMGHRPYVVIAGDFQQLQPVGGESLLRRCVAHMPKVVLEHVYRSEDPPHLAFCHSIRDAQPTRDLVSEYFLGRQFDASWNLAAAVREGIRIGKVFGHPFLWLCVTNKGAAEVNAEAVSVLCEEKLISPERMEAFGFPGDPRLEGGGLTYLFPGALIRFTRNLDKTRGVVNGAVGLVKHFLEPGVCTVQLLANKKGVLVHALHDKKTGFFVPCVQGYATTIRRAQGMSLHCGCLYFNHTHPPDPGYGYVAVSRFRTRAGCFLYGRIRSTDFIPVGASQETARMRRSMESDSDDARSDASEGGYDSDHFSHDSGFGGPGSEREDEHEDVDDLDFFADWDDEAEDPAAMDGDVFADIDFVEECDGLDALTAAASG